MELEEYTFQIKAGDRLVLFSDGVPDAMDNSGEQYGSKRFVECVEAGASLSADALVKHIVDDVAYFCRGAAPFDDLTLLVVEAA